MFLLIVDIFVKKKSLNFSANSNSDLCLKSGVVFLLPTRESTHLRTDLSHQYVQLLLIYQTASSGF